MGRANHGGEFYLKEVVIEVWGDFACFTMPQAKVERLTYPFPPPSAARGILSAIYMKPKEFLWRIDRIEVLEPIRYISFKRNEIKCTVSSTPVSAEEERTQRQTTALQNVRYRIAASIIPRPAFVGRETQLYERPCGVFAAENAIFSRPWACGSLPATLMRVTALGLPFRNLWTPD